MTDSEIEVLASRAVEAENYLEAQRLLEPLADRNSKYALMTLGWIYESGVAGPPSRALALSSYERASQIGCTQAFNFLGRILWEDGNLVDARNAYQTGAQEGHLGCMCWLGDMMLSGKGGPLDSENGEMWIRTAAKNGHFFAKRKLLSIDEQRDRSIFRYLSYYAKLAFLIVSSTTYYLRNPYSDRVF
jgi:uncharacterized protein